MIPGPPRVSIDDDPVSQRGSHHELRHPDRRTVIVPLHRELAAGAFASILRQAGLSAAEFEALR